MICLIHKRKHDTYLIDLNLHLPVYYSVNLKKFYDVMKFCILFPFVFFRYYSCSSSWHFSASSFRNFIFCWNAFSISLSTTLALIRQQYISVITTAIRTKNTSQNTHILLSLRFHNMEWFFTLLLINNKNFRRKV